MFLDWVNPMGSACTLSLQHPPRPSPKASSALFPDSPAISTSYQAATGGLRDDSCVQHPHSLKSKFESEPEGPVLQVLISPYSIEEGPYMHAG